jgi:hypothetical protein
MKKSLADHIASIGSDEDFGRYMKGRYERLQEAYDAGFGDEHPAERWNQDNAVLRAHKVAKDAEGGKPAQDDPPRTTGSPPPPQRAQPALDSASFALAEFKVAHDPDALHLLRISQADPAAVRRMSAGIAGYGRLK